MRGQHQSPSARDRHSTHPGVELRANLKSISHRCYLFEVAFVWELTKETIDLPLGRLQGGAPSARDRHRTSTSDKTLPRDGSAADRPWSPSRHQPKCSRPCRDRLLHRNVQRFRGGLVFKAHIIFVSQTGLGRPRDISPYGNHKKVPRVPGCILPPWRQPRGKWMVALVNSHTNATRIGWHLWAIDSRFAPGIPPEWGCRLLSCPGCPSAGAASSLGDLPLRLY